MKMNNIWKLKKWIDKSIHDHSFGDKDFFSSYIKVDFKEIWRIPRLNLSSLVPKLVNDLIANDCHR